MLKPKNLMSLLVTAAFLLFLAAPALADDDSDSDSDASLVGSWEASAAIGTETQLSLQTYNADGTLTTTASDGNISTAHGVWEKVGERSYVAKVRNFQFDANRALSVTITNIAAIEVSGDGQSFAAEATAELFLPDGTPVGTIPFSFSATRIAIDP